ncbi:hypothetical protein [Candidatus Korobacter versatilis]|nr:hypothetical protein [Candidatus Koribacter versatilis]
MGHKIGIFFFKGEGSKKGGYQHGNEESRKESRKEKEEVVKAPTATEIV